MDQAGNARCVSGLIASGQTATHLWISPLVMKAMWTHSFDLCGLTGASVDPERMLDTHVELILAALRPEPR